MTPHFCSGTASGSLPGDELRKARETDPDEGDSPACLAAD